MVYDIAVIGAGPAGSTFARLAAGGCESLLLIDAQSESCKKPCGGLLAPDAQKALAHFDLSLPKSVLADPQIFSVKTIDLCRKKICYYPRNYLNMDRFAFDKWLVSLIPANADIINGKCVALKKENGVFSLEINEGGALKTVFARRVVGADGVGSIVRKTFFKTRKPDYIAIQQWFKNDGATDPFYSCVFDNATSDCCSWHMYKDDYVVFGGFFRPDGCRAAFESQKSRLADFLSLELGKSLKTEACVTFLPRGPFDFITGNGGAYLIGEAAGFISASSFEGISSAIVSAAMLSEAFAEVGSDGNIAARYRKKTLCLRIKLFFKIIKRRFMYTPFLRGIIMALGIESISVTHSKPR